MGGGRLELREEQVQWVGKKGIGEENQVLSATGIMEEVILDQCQVELKENQDVDTITEAAVSEVNETSQIRGPYLAICEIPETSKEENRN